MKITITLTFLALMLVVASGTSHAVTIPTVPIGNTGNADDTHGAGYGGVDHAYNIGKTEVTNAQYVEFLNGVAKTDSHGLYIASMDSNTRGGITRMGSSGGYSYSVKSDSVGNGPSGTDYTYGDKPVNYVSFWDAARFANWMHNGMGGGDTESGAYSNVGSQSTFARNAGATWFIPTEDEWYKAAYYDPNKSGGAGYWNYPTATDTVPNNNLPSSDSGNSANFSGTTGHNGYPLTDAGAYDFSDSAYGTYDQGGNLFEWNETVIGGSRGLRGGDWGFDSSFLAASNRNINHAAFEGSVVGFRVASVPEPGSITLFLCGALGLLMRRRRPR